MSGRARRPTGNGFVRLTPPDWTKKDKKAPTSDPVEE